MKHDENDLDAIRREVQRCFAMLKTVHDEKERRALRASIEEGERRLHAIDGQKIDS